MKNPLANQRTSAVGSEAPRRFWAQPTVQKAVSPLRSSLRFASPRQAATAVQIFVVRARSCRIVVRMKKKDVIFTVLGVILFVVVGFFVAKPKIKQCFESVGCGNYMSSICFAATLWAEDNNKHMPSDFLSMSNELCTPRILICPGDHSRQAATNWASFTATNSSYAIIAPMVSENDTNTAYLRCNIHTNHLGYVCGYVFDGWRMRTKFP